jgi:glycosyltransferase involved in cell wall biosynthesis
LLWLHDIDVGDRLTTERAERVDSILCLSAWHQEHLASRYPFAEGKLARIRNGITTSYFTTEPAPARQQRVLFTSSPDRGLDLLLEIWPRIHEQLPNATLTYTCAPVYERVADQDPNGVGLRRERIRKLADQPGVHRLPGLGQPELAALMRSSLVWAHPSWHSSGRRFGQEVPDTKFHETACIGAIEAQAAGCCVVAANWGALAETVQVGTLIGGDPKLESFRERFADAIIAAITDERIQVDAQTNGPRHALGLGWDGVAEMVAALIESDSRAPAHGLAVR